MPTCGAVLCIIKAQTSHACHCDIIIGRVPRAVQHLLVLPQLRKAIARTERFHKTATSISTISSAIHTAAISSTIGGAIGGDIVGAGGVGLHLFD